MAPLKTVTFLSILQFLVVNTVFAQFGGETELTDAVSNPTHIKTYDLDNDGDLDVLGSCYWSNRVVWYENLGGGTFGGQNVIAKFKFPRESVAADIDGDGDLDIISTGPSGNGVCWFENLGGANFGPLVSLTTVAGGTVAIVAEDMDSDGLIDIVYASSNNNRVYWIQNQGGQTFDFPQSVGNLQNPRSVFVADLDGDGNTDIITSSYDDNKVVWYKNLGNSTFGGQSLISSSTWGPQSVYAFDPDGDGDQDVFSASFTDDKIAWYANDGFGVFGAQQVISLNVTEPGALSAGDLDGDGDDDLIAASFYYEKLSWFENLGAGSFGPEQVIASSSDRFYSTATGDIDQDGDIDVLSSAWQTNRFLSHENLGAGTFAPPETISSNSRNKPTTNQFEDFDGDGDLDVLVGSQEGIVWFENYGNNAFSAEKVIVNNSSSAYFVVAFDLNQDTHSDIIWSSYSDSTIAWNENLGNGTFGPEQVVSDTIGQPYNMRFGDVNADGLKDLMISVVASGQVVYFESLAGGGFAPAQVVYSGPLHTYHNFELVDVTNDGLLDVLIGHDGFNGSPDKVTWHENIGGGSFGPESVLSTSFNAPSDAAGLDIDSDGDMDVLACNGNNVLIWFENDGGVFLSEQTLSLDAGHEIVICDVNNDGKDDVIVEKSSALYWFENIDNALIGSIQNVGGGFGSVAFISTGDPDGDGDSDLLISDANSNETIILGNSLNYAIQVEGNVFLDMNANQIKDSNESGTNSIGIISNPSSDYTYTFSNGNYFMNFSDTAGVYELSPQTPMYWSISTDSLTYTVVLDSGFVNVDSLNFGFTPDTVITVVEVDLIGGLPRCNTIVNFWLDFENIGTTLPSGVVQLTLDDSISYVNSIFPPDSIVNNSIYWSYDSLFYFVDRQIPVAVQMPDFNSINGDLISVLTFYELDSLGATIDSFTDSLFQVSTCAYDPNDKIATPAGIDSLGYVSTALDQIEYTVRFQNTGNDTAIVVVIKDVLDTNLIWQSLVPIAGSHPFQTDVDQNGEVTFTFDNIMLPDSNVNEIASHGYVRYRIDVKPGLFEGTSIFNTAHIYFDQNPPVVTNTKIHTLFDCSGIDFSVMQSVCVGDSLVGNVTNASSSSTYAWGIPGVYNSNGETLEWLADSVGVFDVSITKSNTVCPSDTIVQVEVTPAYTVDLGVANICQGDSILVFNNYVSASGVYIDSSQTMSGCDSISILTVSVNPITQSNFSETICQGDSILLFNEYVFTAGTYYDTLQTALGCDSVITKILIVNAPDVSTTSTDSSVTSNASGAAYQWLDCDNDFASISGETSPSYYPPTSGSYAVEVSEFGCVDTSACITISVIGLDENDVFENIMIFPNPNEGLLNIELGELQDVDLKIFDASGKIVHREESINGEVYQFNINEPNGTFIIELCIGSECKEFRVVKKSM